MTMLEGHDELCYYCGEPCDSLAGFPSKWPVALCHSDEPGVVKWHHVGCVSERLTKLEKTQGLLTKWEVEWNKMRYADGNDISSQCTRSYAKELKKRIDELRVLVG